MIKVRAEIQIPLVVQKRTAADKVVRFRYPIELVHRRGNTPDTVRVGNVNVDSVPGNRFRDDVVTVLSCCFRTEGLPLGFCRRAKYFWVMWPVVGKEPPSHPDADRSNQSEADDFFRR